MKQIIPEMMILCIIISSLVLIQLLIFIWRIGMDGENSFLSLSKLAEQYSPEFAWSIKLALNGCGYLAIIIPALMIYKFSKSSKYLEGDEPRYFSKLISRCFHESGSEKLVSLAPDAEPAENNTKLNSWDKSILLIYCFMGLVGSFLFWRVFQEKIIKEEYVHLEYEVEIRTHFKESQFLIFVSRGFACVLAGLHLVIHKKPPTDMDDQPALYKYSISSIANIFSFWSQYEALKFISFPTHVIGKSCKIISVMIMGRFLTRKHYHMSEYFVAALISTGMIIFMTESEDRSEGSAITTLTGVFFLIVYMASDSFNCTWQGNLFKTYRMTATEMMFYVNMFSGLFTASSLFMQGGFQDSIEFAMHHPEFIYDCFLLSICAAVGQLFIYYTISKFGASVFTIMMTLRLTVTIILSCVINHRHISLLGIFGISLVFLAIVLRILYCSQRKRRRRFNDELTMANVILPDEREHPVTERI